MSAKIYVEGGGDSKELHTRCREGFRKLFARCGFTGRMPRIVACGGRSSTFDDFQIETKSGQKPAYIAMLIDSEEPLEDLEAAWQHLNQCDGWKKPKGAKDKQVLFMTTCMETWIVADRKTLEQYYGKGFNKKKLPPDNDLESRSPDDVQQKLKDATRNCKNTYAKGKQSFEVLGQLNPEVLEEHLPSFARVVRILKDEL